MDMPPSHSNFLPNVHPRLLRHLEICGYHQMNDSIAFNKLLLLLEQDYQQHFIEGQAQRDYQLKSDLLANLSHEVRTPLHAILSFSRFALEKRGDWSAEQQIENLHKLRSSAIRLSDLMQDLLDLSKLSSGTDSLSLSICELDNLCQVAIELLEPQWQRKQISFKYNQQGSLKLKADRQKMIRVFINLIANAIEYSPIKSCIELQFLQQQYDNTVLCCISDSGVGIPEAEHQRIFDQFVQSSRTRTGAGGTGLGLAICRNILTLHQGEIRAHNNSRGGATFCFTVPAFLAQKNKKNTAFTE